MSNLVAVKEMVHRLVEGEHVLPLTIEQSQHLLSLKFGKPDLDRIDKLLAKNRKGDISKDELTELDQLVDLGMKLGALQSSARMTIKNTSEASPQTVGSVGSVR